MVSLTRAPIYLAVIGLMAKMESWFQTIATDDLTSQMSNNHLALKVPPINDETNVVSQLKTDNLRLTSQVESLEKSLAEKDQAMKDVLQRLNNAMKEARRRAEEAAAEPQAAAVKPDNKPEEEEAALESAQGESKTNGKKLRANKTAKRKTSGNSTATTTTTNNNNNKPPTSCTPADRRALARRNDTATDEEWKAMTDCMVQKYQDEKNAQFFHHISKSGGTAMGLLMNRNRCFGKSVTGKNPWVERQFGFSAQWYRSETSDGTRIKMPAFGMLRATPEELAGAKCTDVATYLGWRKRLGIMSEAVIPFDDDNHGLAGGCNGMLGSIMFREPVARIQSHYQHLRQVCHYDDFRENIGEYNYITETLNFNVSFTRKVFDIVSDNYYARSLTGRSFYEWEANASIPSLNQHPEAFTKVLPTANASLHAYDWVMVLGSGKRREVDDHYAIISKGLGLTSSKGFQRTNIGRKKTKQAKLSEEDKATLKDLNSLDYVLWEEAKELNRLDLIAVQRMEPFLDAFAQAKEKQQQNGKDCCGYVCRDMQQTQPAVKEK